MVVTAAAETAAARVRCVPEVVRAEAAASARRRSGGGGGADDDGAEWLESFSDKHARPFWKNLTTGERTWKRPLGAKVRVHEKKRKRR